MRVANKPLINFEGRKSAIPGWSGLSVLAAGMLLFVFPTALAQVGTQDSGADKSWTATSDSKEDYANPRTVRSHTQSGNRTVDVQSIQARGADGNFSPYQDVETETVRVSSTMTRTTTRTFVRDGSGAKTLFQITEENKQTLPGGDSKVVSTTSSPDANGKLQLVQRENRETHKTGPDTEETKSTVMLPSINGGLAAAMQVQESKKRNGNSIEIEKTTQMPDGAGKWQTAEVRHITTKDDGKDTSTEERVSRLNPEGKLGEVSRTLEKESEDASGEKHKSEETYSVDVPGAPQDSSLHLVQRVKTTQRSNADGQQTTKIAEKSNPGDPGAGLWVSTVTSDTVRVGTSGARSSETIQMRDANGSLDVVSVDMTKSDNAHAVEVQIAPSKPK